MRFRTYKTKGHNTFWAIRLTNKGAIKMVPGSTDTAYAVVPLAWENEGTDYIPSTVELDIISKHTERHRLDLAYDTSPRFERVVSRAGIQFRIGDGSQCNPTGICAITEMIQGKPHIRGFFYDKIRVIYPHNGDSGDLRTDILDAKDVLSRRAVSVSVARKHDPEFTDMICTRYAAFLP